MNGYPDYERMMLVEVICRAGFFKWALFSRDELGMPSSINSSEYYCIAIFGGTN